MLYFCPPTHPHLKNSFSPLLCPPDSSCTISMRNPGKIQNCYYFCWPAVFNIKLYDNIYVYWSLSLYIIRQCFVRMLHLLLYMEWGTACGGHHVQLSSQETHLNITTNPLNCTITMRNCVYLYLYLRMNGMHDRLWQDESSPAVWGAPCHRLYRPDLLSKSLNLQLFCPCFGVHLAFTQSIIIFSTLGTTNSFKNSQLVKTRLICYYVTANNGWFGVTFLNGG